MEIRVKSVFQKIVFLILIFTGSAFSQEVKFFQKLSWEADPDALSYKLELKSKIDGKVQVFETDSTAVEFSLPSGNYEYRIYAYDFLGNESSVTEWKKFDIAKAVKPEVKLSAKEPVKSQVKTGKVQIPVTANNVQKESLVELVNEETKDVVKGSFVEAAENGGEATLEFSSVKEGNWSVVVTNPGGLKAVAENVSVIDEKRLLEEKKAQEEMLRKEEEQKRQEQKRQEQKRQEQERLAKLEEEQRKKDEKLRLEEEKRNKELEQQKRLEEERRQKELAQKQVEEEKLQKELAKKQELEEKRLKEAELKQAEKEKLAKPHYQSNMLAVGVSCWKDLSSSDLFEIFPSFMYPVYEAKLEFLPFNAGRAKIGFDIAASYTKQTGESDLNFTLDDNFLNTGADLVLFIPFTRAQTVDLELSFGGSVFLFDQTISYGGNYDSSYDDGKIGNYGYFGAQGAADLLFANDTGFSLSLGCKAMYIINSGDNFILLAPRAYIGIRF